MSKCYNINTEGYKVLLNEFKSNLKVDNIISRWQILSKDDSFPTVKEAKESIKDSQLLLALKKKEFSDALINNLLDKGWITEFKSEYYINNADPITEEFDYKILMGNIERIQKYLYMLNIPIDAISLTSTHDETSYKIVIDSDILSNTDIISESRGFDMPKTEKILTHLETLFPEVKIEYKTVELAEKDYNELPKERKANIKFNEVNSYFDPNTGTVVLIEGRVTDDTAIEEVLHPFVNALYVSNRTLFDSLLAESKVNFPGLTEEIRMGYTNARGFSIKYRDLELVTQSLTRHFKQEYETQPTKTYLERIKDFIKWFADHVIAKFYKWITGKKMIKETAEKVVSDAPYAVAEKSIGNIINLLNDVEIEEFLAQVKDDVRFDFYTEEERALSDLIHKSIFSSQPVEEINALIKKANNLAINAFFLPDGIVFANKGYTIIGNLYNYAGVTFDTENTVLIQTYPMIPNDRRNNSAMWFDGLNLSSTFVIKPELKFPTHIVSSADKFQIKEQWFTGSPSRADVWLESTDPKHHSNFRVPKSKIISKFKSILLTGNKPKNSFAHTLIFYPNNGPLGYTLNAPGTPWRIEIGDYVKKFPKRLFEAFRLDHFGKKLKIEDPLGWIGGTINGEDLYITELQSDVLQRTFQIKTDTGLDIKNAVNNTYKGWSRIFFNTAIETILEANPQIKRIHLPTPEYYIDEIGEEVENIAERVYGELIRKYKFEIIKPFKPFKESEDFEIGTLEFSPLGDPNWASLDVSELIKPIPAQTEAYYDMYIKTYIKTFVKNMKVSSPDLGSNFEVAYDAILFLKQEQFIKQFLASESGLEYLDELPKWIEDNFSKEKEIVSKDIDVKEGLFEESQIDRFIRKDKEKPDFLYSAVDTDFLSDSLAKAIKDKDSFKQNAIKQMLSEIQSEGNSNIKFMYGDDGSVLGFTYKGEIFLNRKAAHTTLVEEAAHLWMDKIKVESPWLYKEGLKKVQDSIYMQDVTSNPFYVREALKQGKEGSTKYNQYLEEEALSKAIKDKGKQLSNDERVSFLEWLSRLFKKLKEIIGLSKLTIEEVKKLTLNEFSERALRDIFKETKEVSEDMKKLTDLVIQSTASLNKESNAKDIEYLLATGITTDIKDVYPEVKGLSTPEEFAAFGEKIDNTLEKFLTKTYPSWKDKPNFNLGSLLKDLISENITNKEFGDSVLKMLVDVSFPIYIANKKIPHGKQVKMQTLVDTLRNLALTIKYKDVIFKNYVKILDLINDDSWIQENRPYQYSFKLKSVSIDYDWHYWSRDKEILRKSFTKYLPEEKDLVLELELPDGPLILKFPDFNPDTLQIHDDRDLGYGEEGWRQHQRSLDPELPEEFALKMVNDVVAMDEQVGDVNEITDLYKLKDRLAKFYSINPLYIFKIKDKYFARLESDKITLSRIRKADYLALKRDEKYEYEDDMFNELIPQDIIPFKNGVYNNLFLNSIVNPLQGETIEHVDTTNINWGYFDRILESLNLSEEDKKHIFQIFNDNKPLGLMLLRGKAEEFISDTAVSSKITDLIEQGSKGKAFVTPKLEKLPDSNTLLIDVTENVQVTPEIEEVLQTEEYDLKKERHITVIGFPIKRKIEKVLKNLSEEDRTKVKEKINNLVAKTSFAYSLLDEHYFITKEYKAASWVDSKTGETKSKPAETRKSIIQKINMLGIQKFYSELQDILGITLDNPFPHVTLATKGDPMGIGINSEKEFNSLNPVLIDKGKEEKPIQKELDHIFKLKDEIEAIRILFYSGKLWGTTLDEYPEFEIDSEESGIFNEIIEIYNETISEVDAGIHGMRAESTLQTAAFDLLESLNELNKDIIKSFKFNIINLTNNQNIDPQAIFDLMLDTLDDDGHFGKKDAVGTYIHGIAEKDGSQVFKSEDDPNYKIGKELISGIQEKQISEKGIPKLSLSDLSPKNTLSDIARLLNTSDIKFDLNIVPGQIQYSLTPELDKIYKYALASAKTDIQKVIVMNLFHGAVSSEKEIISLSATDADFTKNKDVVVLHEEDHIYENLTTSEIYRSTTESISGKSDQLIEYKLNRDLGNDFDTLLEGLAGDVKFEDLLPKMKIMDSKESKEAYTTLQVLLHGDGTNPGLTDRGQYLAIPQVVVFDKATKKAGKIDLLLISPQGKLKIVDLKTSKWSIHQKDYKSRLEYSTRPYLLKEGSEILESTALKNVKRLTKEATQGIQVNVYARYLVNMGYEISNEKDAISTFHIHVGVKGRGQEQKYTGKFTSEGIYIHEPSAYSRYVNILAPLNIDIHEKETIEENIKHQGDSLIEGKDIADLEQMTDEVSTEWNLIRKSLREHKKAILTKKEALLKVRSKVWSDKTGKETIEDIDQTAFLISAVLNEASSKQQSALYSDLLLGALNQVRKFKKYVEDPNNLEDESYITYVNNFDRFVETYRGLYIIREHVEKELTANQIKILVQLQGLLDKLANKQIEYDKDGKSIEVAGIIEQARLDYIKNIVENWSNREFTDKDLDLLFKEAKDLSGLEFQGMDLSGSRSTFLAVMNQIYSTRKLELYDIIDERNDFIDAAAAKLIKLSPTANRQEIFKYFLEFTDGEFNGSYVTELGSLYMDELRSRRDKVYDINNNPIKYIEVSDTNTADKDDIKFNIALSKYKEKWSIFWRAETIGLNDQPVDGEYHRYTEEYKTERKKYEYFVASGEHGYWKRKNGISNRSWNKYRSKYYTTSPVFQKIEKLGGKATGQTMGESSFPVVKLEYKKPLKNRRSDGKSLVNDRYNAIMKPTTALEKAQKEFYVLFTNTYEELLDFLPPGTRSYMLGRVPLVLHKIINDIGKKSGMFQTLWAKMTRSLDDFISNTSEQRAIVTDEKGDLIDSLPIYYVGHPKTEAQLKELETQINNLKLAYDRKDVTQKKYDKDMRFLKGEYNKLRAKPSTKELNLDMATVLKKFSNMAQHYQTMGTVEDTLNSMIDVLTELEYQPGDKFFSLGIKKGGEFKPKGKKLGEAALTVQRARKFMSMVYYDNDELTKNMFEKVADGLISLSSLTLVAFNPFGSFNNYAYGRISNSIEAIGGRFYSAKAYGRAEYEYNKYVIPGIIQRISSNADRLGKGHYDPKKPLNKYEALVWYFRMMDSDAELRETFDVSEDRWLKNLIFRVGYSFQDGAEYNVQTKVGIAVMMDTIIKNNETGEELSLYDAFEYDSKNQAVKLKKGFDTIITVNKKNEITSEKKFTKNWKYRFRNKIRDTNKIIHGNYARDDRMVIQAKIHGKLLAQFHKWVVPAYNARYRTEYYDENLGWIEGRYLAFVKYVRYIYHSAVNGEIGFSTWKEGFMEDLRKDYLEEGMREKGLEIEQRINDKLHGVYRTLGDAFFIVATLIAYDIIDSLVKGDDDDDGMTRLEKSDSRRRVENWGRYQLDRLYKELILFTPIPSGLQQQYQMWKSPIAASRTLGEVGQAISLSMYTLPAVLLKDKDVLQADSDYVYQRGIRKGELKIWKNYVDIIPGLYAWNKYLTFLNIKDFYIK